MRGPITERHPKLEIPFGMFCHFQGRAALLNHFLHTKTFSTEFEAHVIKLDRVQTYGFHPLEFSFHVVLLDGRRISQAGDHYYKAPD